VAGAEMPFVSVIMPVRNAARHLRAALAAVLGGRYPAERMEVLVVDGRSTDDTRRIVAEVATADPRVRLLDNPGRTAPCGLNVGLRAARGEVVVRLDGHAAPAPDYVPACVDALRRTGAAMVGGPLVGRGETPFGRAVALATATPFGAGDARFRVGGAAGPTDTVYLGAWPRATLERVGPFDEGLARNQDYELALRIRAAGGIVWLDPAIRSTTVTRDGPLALARQYLGYGAGRAGTVARHPGSLRARQAVPALFVALLALLGLVGAGRPAARGALRRLALAYGLALGLASLSAGRGAEVGVGLRLPLAYATMHLAWGAGFWLGLARELPRRRRARVAASGG
jgi:hypothetical protein